MAKRRGNHEGSIYQRKNGSWVAQVRLGGRRIAKTHNTQKECRAWIRQMRDQIENGLHWDAVKVILGEYLNQWLKDIDGTIMPKTLDQYASVVSNQLATRLGKIKLSDLQPYNIQQVYIMVSMGCFAYNSSFIWRACTHLAVVVPNFD